MKALVKKYAKKGIWMDNVEIPKMEDNEVLIKVKKTAICGTDIHIYEWNEWAQHTISVPMVIGHEFVGRVEKVGKYVKDIKIGDLVSAEGHIVCGFCRNCRAGRRHLCKNTSGIGVNRNGAFAEYLVVPSSNVWICDSSFDEELYSIFDPYGNAVHTALKYDVLGEDVLITGAGPIGIMAAAIVKKAGARHVVLTDVNPYRLELAKKMGLKYAINTKETPLDEMQKMLNMTEGFDVGLEMSGNSHAFNEMIDHMFTGGKIALLGLQSPSTSINWEHVVFKGLTISGIYGREMFETWYKMNTLLQIGLDLKPIITHRFPIAEYEAAFEIMASGQSGKVILNWEE